ncbi:LytTR family transcriptional regulator [Dyadobacter sp. CY261]|uniref:LytR/AlgR family response regulator transcription factor n=1 Tax=Dyadobacter sp. CY261 TaxID=2907203 RepID=UPI001F16EEC0|nr:LytTR family DNA-binding domain-containing protein [Dyadobacter sp. CY261]MCF0074398.1 LytTR family transcriptional regulator [Dyadobacter sp. CY261]
MNALNSIESASPKAPQAVVNPMQISVHFMGRTITLHAEQITLLEGDGNYTYVYTCAGTRYLICKTLKSLACKLDDNFIRVHKSFLVNSNYVIGCAHDGRALKMRCGNKAVVSRRKTKEIISIFGERTQRISA